MSPSVSAILLTYNSDAFVEDAIRGLFGQDYPAEIEILISDDASTDRTWEILQREAGRYTGPHRLVLNRGTTNSGSKSAHLNRVFPIASGDVFISFDADDVSEPTRVSDIVAVFRSAPSTQAVYSSYCLVDIHGRPRGRARVSHPPPGANARRWFARVDANAAGGTLAIRREVVERFGPLDADIAEDILLPFRASLLGGVTFIPRPLVRVRRHAGSLTADAEQFRSIEAYRTRMMVGIQRARRNVRSRLADIRHAAALMPHELRELEAIEAVVHDSAARAEMTALLTSKSLRTRLAGLLRLLRAGAYRDELALHACLAMAPGLYLRYKRRKLGFYNDTGG